MGEGVHGIKDWDGCAKHDLLVTLRMVPKLIKYYGSERFGCKSRWWGGGHDGFSFRIETCKNIQKNSWANGKYKEEWRESIEIVGMDGSCIENAIVEKMRMQREIVV